MRKGSAGRFQNSKITVLYVTVPTLWLVAHHCIWHFQILTAMMKTSESSKVKIIDLTTTNNGKKPCNNCGQVAAKAGRNWGSPLFWAKTSTTNHLQNPAQTTNQVLILFRGLRRPLGLQVPHFRFCLSLSLAPDMISPKSEPIGRISRHLCRVPVRGTRA